jgi:hypothetical protein
MKLPPDSLGTFSFGALFTSSMGSEKTSFPATPTRNVSRKCSRDFCPQRWNHSKPLGPSHWGSRCYREEQAIHISSFSNSWHAKPVSIIKQLLMHLYLE